MKLILSSLATITAVMTLLVNAALAVDPAAVATETATNTVCPVTGKAVDPAITTEYEGRKWAFAKEACKTKWVKAREDSLYPVARPPSMPWWTPSTSRCSPTTA